MEGIEGMILYHGSKEIIEFPEIKISKFHKDFYFGFYCTLFEEQARRWAVRFTGKGIINEYEYSPDESLKILKFPEMSEEWPDLKNLLIRSVFTQQRHLTL